MSSQSYTDLPPALGDYDIHQLLVSGESDVFLATDRVSGIDVALKVQRRSNKSDPRTIIYYEQRIYSNLPANPEGIPTFFSGGSMGDWDYIGVELLGPSVATLLEDSGRNNLDLHSVCCIGMQLIDRLALLHDHNILHRNIKPENCVIGLTPGKETTVHLANFGYSRLISHPSQFLYDEDVSKTLFSSKRVHCEGAVYSYRDDFESLALMLIHLVKPYGLPWARRGMPQTDAGHRALEAAKANTVVEGLCNNIESVFKDFLLYCRCMHVRDYPDYQQWHDKLQELVVGKGCEPGSPFHWPPLLLSPRASVFSPYPISPQQVASSRSPTVTSVSSPRPSNLSPITINLSAFPTFSQHEDLRDSLFSGRTTKTALFRMLRLNTLPNANSNRKLADAVLQFRDVLQFHRNGSYMTKEAFEFLNQLINKLAASPEGIWRFDVDWDLVSVKLDELEDLRDEVRGAGSKHHLAMMVVRFGEAHRGKHDKRATKNGFKFLEGLAARLRTL